MKKIILTLLCLTSSALHTNGKVLPTHKAGFCELIAAAAAEIADAEKISKGATCLDTTKKTMESKRYSCLKCGFATDDQAAYSRHPKLLHNHNSAPYSKKNHPCPECHKTFPSPSKLDRHLTVHTKEHPFKCGICHETFTQKPATKSHIEKLHKDYGLPLTKSIIESLIIKI